jgi:hypothetical protein
MEAIILLVAFHCCFLTTVSAQGTPVTLSELMITPAVRKDKGTWFEFYNPGDQSYDLTNRFLALGNYNVSSSTFGISGLQIERFKIQSNTSSWVTTMTVPPMETMPWIGSMGHTLK